MVKANKKVFMKKVLIVTYYWPPSGGSGVQRWLKFVKYLPKYGVEPHVYTPLNPDFDVKDESLLKDIPREAIIVKRKIREPYSLFRAFMGKKKAQGVNFGMTNASKKGIKYKLAWWVRSNLFIPDPRVWWRKPSTKFLKQYLLDNNIQTIITTGPPHSMHLIGLSLKRELKDNLQWFADFRDPWTNIDFFHELALTKSSLRKHKKLEKQVLINADKVITIGHSLKKELEDIGASNVEVITNGYDTEEVNEQKRSKIFTLSHIGLLSKARNFPAFWDAIAKFKDEVTEEFCVQVVGSFDQQVKIDVERRGIDKNVVFTGIVNHKEAINYQYQSSVLLLFVNDSPNAKGILTGKFFEYMASKTPILALGPKDGEVAKVLKETKSGLLADFYHTDEIFNCLTLLYNNFQQGKLTIEGEGIQKYSRENLTKRLVEIIEK